jgi:hypothetical protein
MNGRNVRRPRDHTPAYAGSLRLTSARSAALGGDVAARLAHDLADVNDALTAVTSPLPETCPNRAEIEAWLKWWRTVAVDGRAAQDGGTTTEVWAADRGDAD